MIRLQFDIIRLKTALEIIRLRIYSLAVRDFARLEKKISPDRVYEILQHVASLVDRSHGLILGTERPLPRAGLLLDKSDRAKHKTSYATALKHLLLLANNKRLAAYFEAI